MDNKIIEFSELSGDTDFVNKAQHLQTCLDKIDEYLAEAQEIKKNYDKLSLNEKIELDLFFVYTLNSLYWIHLRMKGVDPSKHAIKNELLRIRQTMLRHKQVVDRMTIRPKLDKAAAQRFVKHGLFDANQVTDSPPNKKIKFDD